MAAADPGDPEISNLIDSIIRGSPVSVSVGDPSLPGCPLIAVSDNFLVLSGYSRQEILGRNCRFLNAGCDVGLEMRRAMTAVCVDSAGKATFGGKLQNRRKDGSMFTNILRLQSIFLGGRRFIVGIQVDESNASVSEKDVQDLENAVKRRGVLAKWMWSKVPRSRASEEDGLPEALVQRVSVVRQPSMLTPDYNLEECLVILVAYRANASVIAAMGEGAASAKVCKTVAEAKAAASSFRRESRVACGEVNYHRAEGFDSGLNPPGFVGEMCHGPTMVLSATNLPRAIAWAQRAKILVLGSFLNVSALVELIVQQQPTPVVLLCAGREGERSNNHCVEHEIFCAYLLHELIRTAQHPALLLLSDTAREVMRRIDPDDPWRSAREEFRRAPATSLLLAERGLAEDVDFCLQVDRYARILPWYSPFLQLFVRRTARNLPGLMRPLLPIGPPADPDTGAAPPGSAPERVPDTVPSPERRSTVRLFLVRHGEYEGELVQGMAGLLDPQLTPEGLATAQRASELLASEPLEVLLFSPLVRTMQTAELIARPHKQRGLVSEICTGLAAVHRGDWSGLTPEQVEEHFPGDLRAWATDPDFKDHGGESFKELMHRTQGTLDRVLDMAEEKLQRCRGPVAVCLVGHSSTVASVVSLVQPGPPSGEQWTAVSRRIGYCSITLLEFDIADGQRKGRVVYVGQVPAGSPGQREPPSSGCMVPGLVSSRHGEELGPARAMAAQRMGRLREDAFTHSYTSPELPLFSRVSIVTLPGEVSPEHDIENRLVVLIDALRMSSTLVTAMGQGLESAQLFSSVMEVTHAVRGYGPCALLGGEQKRVLIPGFDRDNSPRSYLDGVQGKTALFLTTNGTRALPWVRRSKMLVLGSFLNASAVVRAILAHLRDVQGVVFLCSGTERGTVRSHDDELCAGYLLKTLLASHENPTSLILDETAVTVLQKMYDLDSWEALCDAFDATPGAEELRKIQLSGDVEFCRQRDRYRDQLPFYFRNLDVFFSHQVHYDIPVRYEAVKRQRSLGAPSRAASRIQAIQVYLVCQDDVADVFEGTASVGGSAPSSGVAAPSGEAAAAAPPSRWDLMDGLAEEAAIVASSPSHRCRLAAENVARRRLLVELYSGLSPVGCGDWAGLSREEVQQHYPGALARWHEDPDWCGHGGECFREVHTRATSTFHQLLRSCVARGCTGPLVLVANSALIRCIVLASRGLGVREASVAWRAIPAIQDSVTLIEASVVLGSDGASAAHEERQRPGTPESWRFRVSAVAGGAGLLAPLPLSSRSRL